MRALKTILIILAALGVLILILGLMGPKSYRVERSTEIEASPEVVYGYVSRLASMKEWGPWQEMDKDQVQTIEGTDGTVGAVWIWEGDTVGKGRQELTELVQNERVRTKLTFFVPMMGESVSTGTYDLEPTANGTRMTWGFEGENGFLGRAMGVFMDMDKQLGPDFEKGLANLKAMAESEEQRLNDKIVEKTFNGYVVETVERPELVFVGKRATVKFADMKDFYASSLGAANAAVGQAGLELSGYPSGVYFSWDEKARKTELLAGMPVKASADLKVPGMDVHVIPACTMLHVDYYGDYENIGAAHEAFDAMVAARGLTEYGNRIEEYVTDPGTEADPAKWLTRVYCMVK